MYSFEFETDEEAFEFVIKKDPTLLQSLVGLVEEYGIVQAAEMAFEEIKDHPDWSIDPDFMAMKAAAMAQALRFVGMRVDSWFLLGEVSFLDGDLVAQFDATGDGKTSKRVETRLKNLENFEDN